MSSERKAVAMKVIIRDWNIPALDDEDLRLSVDEMLYDAGTLPMHQRIDVLTTMVKRLVDG